VNTEDSILVGSNRNVSRQLVIDAERRVGIAGSRFLELVPDDRQQVNVLEVQVAVGRQCFHEIADDLREIDDVIAALEYQLEVFLAVGVDVVGEESATASDNVHFVSNVVADDPIEDG